MQGIPRVAAPHPAFAAALEGGPIPTDPDVLAEMSEEERTAITVFARLSKSAAATAAPKPEKRMGQ